VRFRPDDLRILLDQNLRTSTTAPTIGIATSHRLRLVISTSPAEPNTMRSPIMHRNQDMSKTTDGHTTPPTMPFVTKAPSLLAPPTSISANGHAHANRCVGSAQCLLAVNLADGFICILVLWPCLLTNCPSHEFWTLKPGEKKIERKVDTRKSISQSHYFIFVLTHVRHCQHRRVHHPCRRSHSG
jgi:hypothetical protein